MSFTNFYEITSVTGKKSYLFGTMHSSLIDLSSLPVITQALDHARCCIFEVNNQGASEELNKVCLEWYIANGINVEKSFSEKQIRTLSRQIAKYYQIPTDSIETIVEQIKKNWPPLYTMHLCYILGLNPQNTGDSLDLKLQTRAEQNKIQMAYLETAAEQLKILIGFNFSYQDQMEIVNLYDKKGHLAENHIKKHSEHVLQTYTTNQFAKLKELFTLNKDDHILVKKYYEKQVLGDRDINMSQGLQKYLKAGSAFIAVGFLHLEGINKILQSEGYTIKAVNELQIISQDELDKLLKKYPEGKKYLFFGKQHPIRQELQKLVSNQTGITKREVETLLTSTNDLHLIKLFHGIEEKSYGSSIDNVLIELKKFFEDQFISQLKKQTENTVYESSEESEASSSEYDWTYD